jgi:hypothetical protein
MWFEEVSVLLITLCLFADFYISPMKTCNPLDFHKFSTQHCGQELWPHRKTQSYEYSQNESA